MRLSQLFKLLAGEIQPEVFLDRFRLPLDEYTRGMNSVGSSVEIEVVEDRKLTIGPKEVKKLCELFVAQKLNSSQLAYIADALQLCESIDFTEEVVADIVEEFTDPEVNGPFTRERAQEVAAGIT